MIFLTTTIRLKDTLEDTFIDDDLFDNTNNKDIKIVADNILRDIKTEQEEIMAEAPSPVLTSANIGLNPYRLKITNLLELAAARIKTKKISALKTKNRI